MHGLFYSDRRVIRSINCVWEEEKSCPRNQTLRAVQMHGLFYSLRRIIRSINCVWEEEKSCPRNQIVKIAICSFFTNVWRFFFYTLSQKNKANRPKKNQSVTKSVTKEKIPSLSNKIFHFICKLYFIFSLIYDII